MQPAVMKSKTDNASKRIWIGVACGCAIGAALLSPRIIPPLDAKQDQFRDQLESGILLVRCILAFGATLALLSLFFLRRGDGLNANPFVRPSNLRKASVIAFLLVAVTLLLAVPRLSTSFWWDELTTLTLVVKRGPEVMLTYSANANNHILNS